MTSIVSVIQKDFQEIFPTIIGNEEGKLSVDDLMENSYENIISEIQGLREGVDPTENTELISFLKLMEVAELDIEYDSHTHYRLKRLSEKYPDQKSFRFFLYRYLLSTSNGNEEFTVENLKYLIKRVFEDEKLMEVTDFTKLSGLGDSIIGLNAVSDELVTILMDTVSHYPKKIILLWITAHLYRVQRNYQEAIRFNKLFLDKIESLQNSDSKEDIDLDFVDPDAEQMVCFQLADLFFYDIGDYTNALYYCNRVLDQGRGGVYSENIKYYYFDTLIIRIRIHMISDDRKAFQKDYTELLKVVSEEELKENYSDIVSH